ncbi:YwqG family protein [Methylobacterium tarhaniae]|nr:YwqG family protein [Methylobacterium tarhaniae]
MSTPLPRTRDEILTSLGDRGLPTKTIDRLVAQARTALLLTTVAVGEDTPPLGSSRLGGAPDLPVGMKWPMRPPYPDAEKRAAAHRKDAERLRQDSRKPRSWMTPEQGEIFSREHLAKADAVERPFPLAFFGQFDLAELSAIDGYDPTFPKTGRLLVFYDFFEQPEDFTPEASVGWRVIWDESPQESLTRAAIPSDLEAISDDDWTSIFEPALIHASPVVTPIPMSDEGWDAFDLADGTLSAIYGEWLSEFGTPDEEDGENHQLGGYPRTLQNGLQATSQLAANGISCGTGEAWTSPEAKALLPSAGEWRLLLQIGVDLNAGMTGPGAYYVIIRNQDLAARRFEQARVTYQCD